MFGSKALRNLARENSALTCHRNRVAELREGHAVGALKREVAIGAGVANSAVLDIENGVFVVGSKRGQNLPTSRIA